MNNTVKNSNKVRFAIIGTNFISDRLLDAAKLDNRFEAVAIYSRSQERANSFAEKHNIANTFTSLEDMANSSLIDAVYVASPTSCHAEQSILLMKHGKHILCEKPLASNTREVIEMCKVAKENNVLLMEAMKSTITPNFKEVLQYIDKIGVIRRYVSSYCQYSSRYDKFKEGIILNAFDPSLSNGAVMDIGVYTIYPMVVLFGRPSKIYASGFKLSTGVDAQGVVNLEYDGMTATVIYSKVADSYLPTEIQGEGGTIIIDKIPMVNNVVVKRKNKDDIHFSEIDTSKEYYFEIVEFIDLLEKEQYESDINSHQNSIITMEIIDEIRKQLGVNFPADKK